MKGDKLILYCTYRKQLPYAATGKETQLFHLIGKHSGHTWKEIEEYFLCDKFMSAPEAKEFGLIDEVLGDTSNVVVLNNGVVDVHLYGDVRKLGA